MPMRETIWVCDGCGIGSTYRFEPWITEAGATYCDKCQDTRVWIQRRWWALLAVETYQAVLYSTSELWRRLAPLQRRIAAFRRR